MIFNRTGRTQRLKYTAATLVLSTVSVLATAQPGQSSSEDTTWYQVEVIIFERLASPRAGDPEVWPKDIVLDYPANWQKLVDPETAADWIEDATQEATSAFEAAQAPGESLTATPPLPAEASREPTEGIDTTTDMAFDAAPAEEIKTPMLQHGDQYEFAYVRLPASERTLNESKSAIARNRLMRVVFHEAWRQPLSTESDSPAVIIRGGNEYGEHTELEGSLHLSVSRYLHLRSNLWFTQFVPNFGQEAEFWPPLPAVPKREWRQQPIDQQETLSWENEEAGVWQITAPESGEYAELIDRPYLIKQIITLTQNRRMRSGELHYIDHPRLGLLIKIDSYTPGQEQETKP